MTKEDPTLTFKLLRIIKHIVAHAVEVILSSFWR